VPDNVTMNPGTGGDTIAADDVGGIKVPRSKIVLGADGVNDGDVSGSNPMPVAGTVAATQSGAWTVTGAGGTFPVTDSGGSLTVDGTVAATQSGTWTVGISASQTIAVTGTFWQATQPVSNAGTFAVQAAQSGTWNVTNVSGTVSLPTGAATAAKQPALGTAGVASADVLTVQGIASMTALKVDGSGVTQPVSGTVTANAGTGTFTISGAVTQSGTWNVGTVTTVTGVTTVTTVSTVTSLTQFNGNAIDTNSGVKSAGTLRVVIATDQPALTNKLLVTADPITFASAQAVTQSGTWTVQPGNTANTTPWLVTDTPATSGGLSKFHLVSAGSTNATNVKALAGQVYCITAFNTNAAARYLKFHNTAGTPTAGSGVTDTFMIPGGPPGPVWSSTSTKELRSGLGSASRS
jgi:hypothetical protein